ncbi:hypothetical protein [Pseudofrankia sp. BMG5.37]|uniref:hypothetical protein n=1 Tax=Pseudofrankia sp. BMG5.37 TaxID=3050035 RepID=UPI000ACFB987|nr:hypothetical protein [Pseudofrankia sp. BMG5.37]MDT3440364.1 hypothetical protein [Pseudofrankia sp. BMG5.37]
MTDDGSGPTWPRNAAGETYGSGADGLSRGDRPDLISAGTRNGKRGYVRRTELEAAIGTGLPPAALVEWNKKVAARAAAGERTLVPVYEQDGVTVIGSFAVGSAQPAQPARPGRPGPVRRAAAPASDAPVEWYYGRDGSDFAG